MSKHKGEPEYEVFEPGDVIRIKAAPYSEPGRYEFLVMVGGYCTVGEWAFHAARNPLTSEHFEKVSVLHEHELTSYTGDVQNCLSCGVTVRVED